MGNKGFKDTDFLCVSARLHAHLSDFSPEVMSRIASSDGFDEAYRQVCDYYGIARDTQPDYGKMLSERLTEAYAFADELINGLTDVEPKPTCLIAPFRYAYDGTNLKTLIKSRTLGKDARHMLSKNGTVSVEDAIKSAESGDFSRYPKNMAASAVEASNVLAETCDPQACGSIIDKAVFADMSHTARQSRNDYLRRLVECKADSVNITSAVRCIRLGVGFSAFAKMIVPGGKLDVEFFEKCYGSSPEALMSALEFTDYAGASSSLEVERRLANMYYETACEAEKIPFGAELLVCCIVKKEYEIRNFRVILAGKACGLDAAKIKERLVIAK